MGIYKASKTFNKLKASYNLKTFSKSENVTSVGIDAEYAIGSGRDLHLSDIDLKNYIINKFIDPFIKNGIYVYMVFGNDTNCRDINTNRHNDILKWKKSVLKAYTNQRNLKINKDILRFLWNEIIEYFKLHPPNKTNFLYNVYLLLSSSNVNNNTIYNIINNSKYKKYIDYIPDYVWKKSDILYLLYEKIIINKNTISINDIPRNIFWKLAYYHWENNMKQKRLIKHIQYIKQNIKNYVPIVISPYDGDDQLSTMVEAGIIQAIVSGDSDFFAFNSNIVITNMYKNHIEAIKLSDIYHYLQENGYSYNVIRTAMIISSADYNYDLYKYKIPFNTSLTICKKLYKQGKSYFDIFEYFCNKYNIIYNENIAKEISKAYTLSITKKDIVDSISAVINSITSYLTIKSNIKNKQSIYYMYFIKILLLSVITNTSNLLLLKDIYYKLNISNKLINMNINIFTETIQVV